MKIITTITEQDVEKLILRIRHEIANDVYSRIVEAQAGTIDRIERKLDATLLMADSQVVRLRQLTL
ncbi:MAG: hypothetical protein JWM81_964 [Candidatus Saccharibacteria bacterium]|nr:hypothetical protein [Candidatus Saccharibacteria bacterium]